MKLHLNSSIINVLLSSLFAFPDLILLQNKPDIDSGKIIRDDCRNDAINDCYGVDVCELINPEDFIVVSEIISPVCLNFCNQNFNSEPGDCDSNGNSLWFAILPEDSLTNLILQIYTEFKPIVSVYKGNYCDSLTEIISCYDNKLIYLPSIQNSELTYVKIEAKNGEKLSDFEVCISSLAFTVDCYDATGKITRPEYPLADPAGPFYPGETINLCMHIDFVVAAPSPPNGNNCQWIQGILPTFGNDWDVANSNIPEQDPGGSWFWLPEGSVDFNHQNFSMFIDIKLDSTLDLTYDLKNKNVIAGSLLPGGWWITSNGSGASCTNDGDPDNMWGDPFSCSGNQIYEFCYNIKIKDKDEISNCDDADLRINTFVFSDGQTGCWSQISCDGSLPFIFEGEIDCQSIVSIDAEEKSVCHDELFEFNATVSDSNSMVQISTLDNSKIIGDTINLLLPADSLYFYSKFKSTSREIEEVTFLLTPIVNDSNCICPTKAVKIKVYPSLEFELPYYVCSDDSCYVLQPLTSNNQSNYNYHWNNNETGNSLQLCETNQSFFSLTITNELGCFAIDSTTIDYVRTDSLVTLTGSDTLIYSDFGIDYNYNVDISSNQSLVDSIIWTYSDNINGFSETVLSINDRFYVSEFYPDTINSFICAEVILNSECKEKICKDLYIDNQVSIKDYEGLNFEVFPNPAHTHLNIKLKENFIKNIEVISIEGKSVFQQKLTSNKSITEIDIANLLPGLYIIKLNNNLIKKFSKY